jgi:predicted GH43/DUF377 family glycosyl hydrolase
MKAFSQLLDLKALSKSIRFSWQQSVFNLWRKNLADSNKNLQNDAVKSPAVALSTQDKICNYYASLLKIDRASLENVFISQNGISVFFHVLENNKIKVQLQLFELSQPDHALFFQPKLIADIGDTNDEWEFLELVKVNSNYKSLWRNAKLGFKEITYPNYLISNEIELKNPLPKLAKPSVNPILSPNSHNSWEAFCTFNPAAIFAADKVHLLYRAQGHDYISKIGYASSEDGLQIDHRSIKPIYVPTQAFEGASMPPGDPDNPFVSGGGCGGCEDPRATIINDRIYMTYVAYNGWDHPRIAITSIALTDFLNERLLWEKPVLISRPGIVDKSACLFPEKINGKYVIMHRVFPNIYIDYVDDLNFSGQTFLSETHKIRPRDREWWDSRKIGAGAPPLRTKDGWLLIYQAVDEKDASEYKVGAMLLDLNDPSKVLYRSTAPILEPREKYENNGFKSGVVYPCGAVIKNEMLFVYYGAADSYVCVATANLEQFLSDLKKTGKTTLDSSLLVLDTQPVLNTQSNNE